MALVHLEHVTKRFGADRPPATDGLSFTVESGRILALLGPSGCGKTTTLRLIAGFETPDRGRIAIAGQTVADADRGIHVEPEPSPFIAALVGGRPRFRRRSILTGASAPGTMYQPLSGNVIVVHASHSATVPVTIIDRGATPRNFAPRRQWTRSHGSNGAPSARAHRR